MLRRHSHQLVLVGQLRRSRHSQHLLSIHLQPVPVRLAHGKPDCGTIGDSFSRAVCSTDGIAHGGANRSAKHFTIGVSNVRSHRVAIRGPVDGTNIVTLELTYACANDHSDVQSHRVAIRGPVDGTNIVTLELTHACANDHSDDVPDCTSDGRTDSSANDRAIRGAIKCADSGPNNDADGLANVGTHGESVTTQLLRGDGPLPLRRPSATNQWQRRLPR
jgi:hypothetical protein